MTVYMQRIVIHPRFYLPIVRPYVRPFSYDYECVTGFMQTNLLECDTELHLNLNGLCDYLPHQDIQGYKWVRWRVWLCRLAALLSLGLLLIVFHWRPRLAVLARCCSCPLALADILLIRVRQ